jgi:proteasome lid subunit RPN8/RPN11
MGLVEYPPELLDRIGALCEADPLREVCGFVVSGPSGALEVAPISNAAPPAQAGSRFLMAPDEQLRAHLRLGREGGRVIAVYHSHVAGSARFSARDRGEAVWDGKPLLSGAEYLVFGLRSGRVEEVRRYCWDGADFTEEQPVCDGPW